MGMFDWYEPTEPLRCPVCRQALREWQGADGPCALVVWRQGRLSPIAQRVESEYKISESQIADLRLPQTFHIHSQDCPCRFSVEAVCHTFQGVWTSATVITARTAQQKKWETRAQWRARWRWLATGGD
jgi:hypothetical protein